ncbi:hypothetical protein Tco_0075194, partial [Tanacetum coccineum]
MAAPTIPISTDSAQGSSGDMITSVWTLSSQSPSLQLLFLQRPADIAEAENASLIEQQLASIQESYRQDREDFRKLKDFMT